MSLRHFLAWFFLIATLAWGCSSTPAESSDDDDSDCSSGLASCGGECRDLSSDVSNCGACGRSCAAGQVCQTGACQCLSGLQACGSVCADVRSDPANCGGCGTACQTGLFCSLGSCSDSCADGLAECGASCVDLANTVTHCGACNNACPLGLACVAGGCACPSPGQQACGDRCVDVGANAAHCGACGNACGTGQTCAAGVCSGGGSAGSGGVGGMAGASGSGTGGSGGATGTPNGLPGVVVSTDANGTLGCVPLCMATSHPDDADTTDDWAWEGYACVLPDSPTGTRNQACTTGEPLPPIDRDGFPGVVVATDAAGTLTCVPLCAEGAMPSNPDPANPSSYEWGWEFQASCIIRDTTTSTCNQACITGQALPSPTLVQRPGVLIDDVCTALCECASAGDDPNWGWEYQAPCVMPDTPASTGLPACTTNDSGPLLPPPLTGNSQPGFYVQDGRLYDARGSEFVMRGVNNPHIWFDSGNRYLAYQALDSIASYNTNTIRVVWETTGGSAALLRRVLHRIVELEMVPMVELHDVTGGTSNAELLNMARYYLTADVKQVLIDFRGYLLVNIANEWSGNDFQNGYRAAITELRNGGIDHTLVIDANGFGQNASSIFDNATALMSADPRSNLLFSVHMYSQYGTNAAVDAVLDRAASSMVPLIVGEFGPQLQGQNVAWTQITAKCQEHRLGYLAWSWSGNDASTQNLNIVNDFGGALTPSWGRQIMVDNANSIQRTSMRASIFQ